MGKYIVIEDFMVKDLQLKGNDLLVYAIIYGFSQDGKSGFAGTLQYLADWCGATKHGVMKNLKNLTERNLITKEEHMFHNCKYNLYRVTELHSMKLSYIGYTKDISNKDLKEEDNKEEGFIGSVVTKSKKKNKYEKCNDLIPEYVEDEKLQDLLQCYLKLRLEMSDSPIYVNQWKGLLNKLVGMSEDTEVLCDIVQQSIDRGYRSFFPITKRKNQGFTEAISKTTPEKSKKQKEGSNISGRKF